MVRYLNARDSDPWRGPKRLAFDRYGAIQVHIFYIERRVPCSERGHLGPH